VGECLPFTLCFIADYLGVLSINLYIVFFLKNLPHYHFSHQKLRLTGLAKQLM